MIDMIVCLFVRMSVFESDNDRRCESMKRS